jgi:hypothetical protein
MSVQAKEARTKRIQYRATSSDTRKLEFLARLYDTSEADVLRRLVRTAFKNEKGKASNHGKQKAKRV